MKRLSLALRERLGDEAAQGLEEYAEGLVSQGRDEVMQSAAERFDNRLATVAGGLRSEMTDLRAGMRTDMIDLRAGMRTEMADLRAGMRAEMAELRADMRVDMTALRADVGADMTALRAEVGAGMKDFRGELQKIWQTMADLRVSLRNDLADNRVELVRWSFAFWIGQVAVLIGVLAYMLRGVTSH